LVIPVPCEQEVAWVIHSTQWHWCPLTASFQPYADC